MTVRTFALIWGIGFALAGIAGILGLAGYVPALVSDQHDGHGLLLGLFPVNQLHNAVHLVFGLWGLAASRSAGGSLLFARGVALIYLVLAVLGLVPATQDGFGLVPLHGNDVWLHLALGLPAAYFGWMRRSVPSL